MPLLQNGFWEFDEFRLDVRRQRLLRGTQKVPLTHKGITLLLALVENSGRVVSRDELKKAGWPEAVAVENGNLQEQIYLIRRALGDTAREPRFVATVNTEGYRFVPDARYVTEADADTSGGALRTERENDGQAPAALRALDAPAGARVDSDAPIARPQVVSQRTLLLLGAFVLAVAALIIAASIREAPLPRLAGVTKLTHDGHAKDGLMLLDGSRLLVTRGPEQTLVWINGERRYHPSQFKEYLLLDVSAARGEALAIRPHDRGAEGGLWIVPLRGGAPQRLGMVRTDGSAAWSNDGQSVVYSFEWKLFITDRDGAVQKQLQAFSGMPAYLRWSPNGRFIRFTLTTFSDRVATQTLMDINADGTGLRKVAEESVSSPDLCCGSWIPDGRHFVYEAGPHGSRQIWLLREPKHLFGRRPPERRRLVTESLDLLRPVPSLDGKRIFTLGRTEPQLAMYDVARREFVPYLKGVAAYYVDFARDASWIAYVTFPARTMWRARPDGSDARQLTSPPLEVHGQPAWSPDGRWIAFRGQMPGKRAKVYVMASEGGNPEPLDARDVEQGIPSWSPDSTELTFGDVPEHFGHPTGSERIHIYNRMRRALVDVPDSGGLWSSRWSPDGRYLAAKTIEGQELRLFDFTTKQWRRLGVSHMNNPTWSSDSKYVYCDPEGPEVWFRRVRIADGAVERIVDLSDTHAEWVGVTPDGTPLISRRATDVYALELHRP